MVLGMVRSMSKLLKFRGVSPYIKMLIIVGVGYLLCWLCCGEEHDMAYPDGVPTEIALVMSHVGQQVMNVWQYTSGNIAVGVEAVHIAEAWWNHVKATYSALAITGLSPAPFQSVRIRELNNPVGAYAEFSIPTAEQSGTRTPPSQPQLLPPFTAAAVRLAVGTRATRPGQKRFPFLTEEDNASGNLQSAFNALVVALMNNMDSVITLGAPAATATLTPIIVSKDDAGNVTASQPWTTYVISPYVSSQNTRKIGRGA